ncbi:hypothetical protein Taro_035591 [Colocasia esculenta]|uniref:Uncharacterized protein n=1 Tax=Colocasia esculenta TaxID=4460 RepID=A0A843WFB2_COLES|nr:hypothetical protein [Colocasia esculenta]
MGVVIELSELATPRLLPPPEFSVPFASPSLQWGCRKRLRCFNPAAADPSFSPSPSREHRLSLCPGSTVGRSKLDAASPTREAPPTSPLHQRVRGSPSPPAPLPLPSGRPRGPIRLTYPPEDKEEGLSALPVRTPDLFSGVPAQTVEAGDEESRPWTLRSRVHAAGGLEEGKRKRRKVELWVSLSRDEIEEDFLWMTGAKPPRRSRRRTKVASDQLQRIFPGSWMPTKITAERVRRDVSPCRLVPTISPSKLNAFSPHLLQNGEKAVARDGISANQQHTQVGIFT